MFLNFFLNLLKRQTTNSHSHISACECECDLIFVVWSRQSSCSNTGCTCPLRLDDSVVPFALDPTGHSCDQCGALPASILGLVESHLTLRCQILQRFLHDSGETIGKIKEQRRRWRHSQKNRKKNPSFILFVLN